MLQPVLETRTGECSVIEAQLPGRDPEAIGVMLCDPASDALYLRLRRDWSAIAGDEDAEVVAALADDLAAKAGEMGARRVFEYLEDTLSNTVQVSGREAVTVDDFSRALNRLYRRHVKSNVQQFVTHLPVYTLQA